jgi:hypothetical protein
MLIVLIYAISLSIQPTFKLNIHNWCWDVNLVSPTYITGDELECHKPPDYIVYAEDTMKSGFIINKLEDVSYGILIYRIQRKQTQKSTETGENTSSAIHLLVIWRISKSNMLYADVLLAECDKTFIWNEGKLKKLCHKNIDRLKKCNSTISNTWFMGNNVVLETSFNASDLKENPELTVSISEEEKGDHTMGPFSINLERWVA